MDPRELGQVVRGEISDAVTFLEEEIGPRRAQSIRYYRGERMGDEEDGRSQVVARVLREAVGDTIPSLMRVFFGGPRAVEYVPTGPEDVEAADQATDFVNYIILQDNPGVEIFHSVLKDSLYQIAGIVKYWPDDKIEVSYHEFSGKSEIEIGIILQQPGAELVNANQRPDGLIDILVKRTRKEKRIRLKAVPGEEFLIDRNAITIDDARYVGHRALLPFHELVAMGYDPDMLEGHIHHTDRFQDSTSLFQRYSNQGGYWANDANNPAERRVLYTESWVRADVDGDGYAELRKFCTMGNDHEIVNGDGLGEPATERPFVAFCPDPEPHLFYGSDLADQVNDLQLIKSNIWRRMLDSGADSIYPRTVMKEGAADYETVASTETGAIIIEYESGAVRELVKPFIGKEMFPLLEYVDSEVDRRIGRHNMALNADALQSTTKMAVNAQVQAAQARIEMIARLYAESFRRLYSGLLRLCHRHMDKQRVVRLRGRWVEVDPASWNANMDVTVNVGLGHGLDEERMQTLQMVASMQQTALEKMGPSNPLVGFGHLRNTLAKMLEIQGFKDPSQFFKQIPVDWEPPPQPPQPSDTEILAKVETQKTAARAIEGAEKIALDRDKALLDAQLKAREQKLKYGDGVSGSEQQRTIETDKLNGGR